ncbi:MAG: hypothetical protein PVI21_01275 [Candidatus Woesebacteria bacterium]|jgi:hypothetical protein
MHNQKGFSPILIIITIATIALLGFIAWRVWDANQNKSTNNNQSTNQAETTENTNSQSQQTTKPTQTTDPNQGYVVIKEWGVRFKPVEGLDAEDVVYKISQDENGYGFVAFSTKNLISLDAACSVDDLPIGTITRTGPQGIDDGAVRITIDDAIEIDGYYYLYMGPQALCGTSNAADVEQSAERELLSESVKTLEKVTAL